MALVGCSSIKEFMYKDTCTTGDWQTVGARDGEAGRPVSDFNQWPSRCESFGAKPNKAEYEKGHLAGTLKYCYNSAFDTAKKGMAKNVSSTCSTSAARKQYDDGYSTGLTEFCSMTSATEQGRMGADKNQACDGKPDYKAGYAEGLKTYCAYDTAFTKGQENTEFSTKNCPAAQRGYLQAAYNKGQSLVKVKAQITQLETEIADLEQKIYAPNVPADAKGYYQNILATKKTELKAAERNLYELERRRM